METVIATMTTMMTTERSILAIMRAIVIMVITMTATTMMATTTITITILAMTMVMTMVTITTTTSMEVITLAIMITIIIPLSLMTRIFTITGGVSNMSLTVFSKVRQARNKQQDCTLFQKVVPSIVTIYKMHPRRLSKKTSSIYMLFTTKPCMETSRSEGQVLIYGNNGLEDSITTDKRNGMHGKNLKGWTKKELSEKLSILLS